MDPRSIKREVLHQHHPNSSLGYPPPHPRAGGARLTWEPLLLSMDRRSKEGGGGSDLLALLWWVFSSSCSLLMTWGGGNASPSSIPFSSAPAPSWASLSQPQMAPPSLNKLLLTQLPPAFPPEGRGKDLLARKLGGGKGLF